MIPVFDLPTVTATRVELDAVPSIGESVMLDDTLWEVYDVTWVLDSDCAPGPPEAVVELAEK